VADQSGATCAVGVSRGARALVGILADDPTRFDRIVLVIPPGGTAAGRYREWLLDLPPHAVIDVMGRRCAQYLRQEQRGHADRTN
jgi:hypothetical protein